MKKFKSQWARKQSNKMHYNPYGWKKSTVSGRQIVRRYQDAGIIDRSSQTVAMAFAKIKQVIRASRGKA